MTELPNLELIQERFYNHIKPELSALKYYPEFELTVFLQTWGSTTLGFGGIGGQAITSAYTTVIWEENTGFYGVFFGERLAYVIKNPNDLFIEDLRKQRMNECSKSGVYRREKTD